ERFGDVGALALRDLFRVEHAVIVLPDAVGFVPNDHGSLLRVFHQRRPTHRDSWVGLIDDARSEANGSECPFCKGNRVSPRRRPAQVEKTTVRRSVRYSTSWTSLSTPRGMQTTSTFKLPHARCFTPRGT